MSYEAAMKRLLTEDGVEESTMMKSPCLRYRGKFMAMMFRNENALIIKVAPERVNELIATGKGRAFNFTKKQFREWVLIDQVHEADYEERLIEALTYARTT